MTYKTKIVDIYSLTKDGLCELIEKERMGGWKPLITIDFILSGQFKDIMIPRKIIFEYVGFGK